MGAMLTRPAVTMRSANPACSREREHGTLTSSVVSVVSLWLTVIYHNDTTATT